MFVCLQPEGQSHRGSGRSRSCPRAKGSTGRPARTVLQSPLCKRRHLPPGPDMQDACLLLGGARPQASSHPDVYSTPGKLKPGRPRAETAIEISKIHKYFEIASCYAVQAGTESVGLKNESPCFGCLSKPGLQVLVLSSALSHAQSPLLFQSSFSFSVQKIEYTARY